MNRKYFYTGFLIFLTILALSGCARKYSVDQINFGVEAAKRNLWEEAIFRWKKVVKAEPNNASAHNNLAVAYEKKGLFLEAEKEYKIAIQLKPKDDFIQSNYKKFVQDREGDQEKKEEKDEKK